MVRRSRTDPVVNAARGAEVGAGSDLLERDSFDGVMDTVGGLLEAVDRLDLGIVLEMGADLVIDVDGRPHLIEVNSRPRGRMEVLATMDPGRWRAAHIRACGRPIEVLASLA